MANRYYRWDSLPKALHDSTIVSYRDSPRASTTGPSTVEYRSPAILRQTSPDHRSSAYRLQFPDTVPSDGCLTFAPLQVIMK